MQADQLFELCHQQSKDMGWWSEPPNDLIISLKLMLIVSEIAEGFEGLRKSLKDDHLPHRDMLEVELADAVIRIADLAEVLNYNLEGAMLEKLKYNRTRFDHSAEGRAAEGGKKF